MRSLVSWAKPQKGGLWEEEPTGLEEAWAQGTAITGVGGPRGSAAGKRPKAGPGRQQLGGTVDTFGVKEQKIRKGTSLLSQNQIKLLKT